MGICSYKKQSAIDVGQRQQQRAQEMHCSGTEGHGGAHRKFFPDNARQEATARVSAGGVTVSLHVAGDRGNSA